MRLSAPSARRSRLLNSDASRSSLDDAEAFDAVGALLAAFRACRVPPSPRESPLASPTACAARRADADAAAPADAFRLDAGAAAWETWDAAAALQPLTLAESTSSGGAAAAAAAATAPTTDGANASLAPPAPFSALLDRLLTDLPPSPRTPDAAAPPPSPLRRLSARLSASVKRASERFAEL
jgi:hypothetical protein